MVAMGLFLLLLIGAPLAAAEDEPEKGQSRSAISYGLLGIGAALAVGLGAIGTALAQARIGSAGIGALAENPKLLGSVILLLAVPETLVILGFVVAFMLISKF
ncbi:MAG: F0F1 ATP synthase subunit C [Planctomycetota bacterium]